MDLHSSTSTSTSSHTTDDVPIHPQRHLPPPASPTHVVLVAFPAQSHVNALLSLARLLASTGITVTFVAAQHRISRILQEKYESYVDSPSGVERGHGQYYLGPLIRLVGLPERVPLEDHQVDIDEAGIGIGRWIVDVATEMKPDFEHLLRGLQDMGAASDGGAEAETGGGQAAGAGAGAGSSSRWHPSAHDPNFAAPPYCIITDAFVCWASEVAASFNLKHYVFFPMSAFTLSLMLRLPLLISQGHIPKRLSAQPHLLTLPGLPPLWNKDIPDFFRESDHKSSQEAILKCGFQLLEASNILINTTYEVEAATIDGLPPITYANAEGCLQIKERKIRSVGPVLPLKALSHPLPSHSADTKYECLRSWLNSKACGSVLYVCFGSIHVPSAEEIIELALGLEAAAAGSSGSSFLWVLKRPPSMTAPTHFSVFLPHGFQSRLNNRCFIIPSWAPQLLILSHPSVGAFLTHCGWNSVFESMSFGKPLIAYPQFSEQRLNCRTVVDDLKVGVELQRSNANVVQREEVERVVRLVMEGSSEEGIELRKNAARLKDIITKSVEKYGSSYQNLEEFAGEIFQLSADKAAK